MLALKDWPKVTESLILKSILDLPDELLDLIVLRLYLDNGSFVRDLLPVSRACRRLRGAATPILFHTFSVRITQRYVDRRTFNILLNFDLAPHTFASQVRHLRQDDSFVFREDGCDAMRLSNDLVRGVTIQGLKRLTGLRALSVGCFNSPLVHLMRQAFPEKVFRIRVQGCNCPNVNGTAYLLTMAKLFQSQIIHHFEIEAFGDSRQSALGPFLEDHPESVRALSWMNVTHNTRSIVTGPPPAAFGCLEELHLRNILDPALGVQQLDFPLLSSLKRLSLRGPEYCAAGLKIVSRLENLECLRLNTVIDRIFHANLRNHSFEGLPYLRLPNLKSLEIRYISRYLSIEHVVPPNIKHLRIEYHTRNERLTPFDIRWISRHAPQIECLELNAGVLANLWHPTAIAGVDVDVEVYGMLEALSSFKHLHTLRLFPSYWQSTAGYLHFAQPVTDEQAVRIFHHLRPRCPKLRLLLIANSSLDYQSRHEVFSRGIGGEPVKWMVRPYGSTPTSTSTATTSPQSHSHSRSNSTSTVPKTLLTTHEAKKNYHLEQIWEGERRLTMTTIRHAGGRRLHFDELVEDWALPMYELPFDEPRPCIRGEPVDSTQQVFGGS